METAKGKWIRRYCNDIEEKANSNRHIIEDMQYVYETSATDGAVDTVHCIQLIDMYSYSIINFFIKLLMNNIVH